MLQTNTVSVHVRVRVRQTPSKVMNVFCRRPWQSFVWICGGLECLEIEVRTTSTKVRNVLQVEVQSDGAERWCDG